MKATSDIIQKNWRQGQFEPVYFFYGEEDFLIEHLCRTCVQLAVDPASRDFNLNVIYGSETDGATIVNYASAYPMMAERRVVLVKNINQLKAADLDLLIKYVQRPLASTCLVLTADKIDARKATYKRLLENSSHVELKQLYDNMVPDWIRQYVQDLQLSISEEAIRMLQGTVGNSLRRLATEIEKIRINLQDRSRIEVGDVENVVGSNRQFSIFELCDAIGRRKILQSLLILRHLIRQGETPTGIIAMITRHFIILSRLKAAKTRRAADQSIARDLHIHPFFLKNYSMQAASFSPQQIAAAFEHLLEADQRLKSSQSKPGLVMELMILNLQLGDEKKDPGTFTHFNGY
ncbi:DNA polymerase III subunit delta [candidate division KSB1 bacterium]|nr:DNA polymerase III subunit delta [candidate division KSB1 bacterium]